MAEIAFDVLEQILLRLDVKSLIRCKSVCKLWQSFIYSRRFLKAYLNGNHNKDRKHRKLAMRESAFMSVDELFYKGFCHIVGSSNGLVCISPFYDELLVTNPLTREVKELQPLDGIPTNRWSVCWGFGYDPSTDDYKVIAGFRTGENRTGFYVLTLKSNIWKLIGDVNYKFINDSRHGILCDGSLHWFMSNDYKKKVILSVDLSRDEFKEIPQPDDNLLYDGLRLGIIEECLCIYDYRSCSSKIWVMKNYGVKQSWELSPYDCEMEYGVAAIEFNPYKNYAFYHHHDGIRLACKGDYIAAPIFLHSLVSPHVSKTSLRQKMRNAKGPNALSCMKIENENRKPVAKKVVRKEIDMSGFVDTRESHERVGTVTSGSEKRKRKKSCNYSEDVGILAVLKIN